MRQVTSMLFGALAVLAVFQGGCSGCSGEEYYCDETGCYWCDSYGCRSVEPPAPTACRGDWECPSGQICTREGCAPECTDDADCPEGLDCRDGLCLAPGPESHCSGEGGCADGYRCVEGRCVVELDPGRCPGGAASCDPGEFCAPSLCCLPEDMRGTACCETVDCGPAEVCRESRCETSPTGDAGTGDGGTGDGGTGDGGVDVPIPEPQCRTNADCPNPDYLCIDAVCKLPCRTDAECGEGCTCVGGFCTDPTP